MEQKQRDKVAWVLAPVLVLVLIYLLAVNVFKVGKKSPPPPPAAMTQAFPAQPAPPAVVARAQNRVPATALDLEVLAEQQRVAARLPRRNPFSATAPERPGSAGALRPGGQAAGNLQLAVDNEIEFKVTAIVSQQGANKRIAMINGQMLGEGDRIEAWTVLKVNAKNVVLGNGARQRIIWVK